MGLGFEKKHDFPSFFNLMISWGEYLTRGYLPISTLKVDKSVGENEEDNNVQDIRVKKVLSRVEIALKGLGVTPFSTSILIQFISSQLQQGNSKKLNHVLNYLLQLISSRSVFSLEEDFYRLRKGCAQIIPNLTSRPFWSTDDFPWILQFQSYHHIILEEFYQLKEKIIQEKEKVLGPNAYSSLVTENEVRQPMEKSKPSQNDLKQMNTNEATKKLKLGFQQYSSPRGSSLGDNDYSSHSSDVSNHHNNATDRGRWNVCYFYLNGINFEENIQNCPRTIEAIKSIPRQYYHCMFSALAPQTHIIEHYGPTNKKLRIFLPLIVPDATSDSPSTTCWIRVNGVKQFLQPGKCIIFDDSFLHDAGNESSSPRIVLIVDIWHPDLSNEEIKILEYINKAQILAAKRMNEQYQKQLASEAKEKEEQGKVEAGRDKTVINQAIPGERRKGEEDFFSSIYSSNIVGISDDKLNEIWS